MKWVGGGSYGLNTKTRRKQNKYRIKGLNSKGKPSRSGGWETTQRHPHPPPSRLRIFLFNPLSIQFRRTQITMRRPHRKGFTLVELLIVVSILGISAALAVPMLRNSELNQLRAAGDLLLADLAYAQAEAIAHADDRRVIVLDIAGNRYHLAAGSTAATPLTDPVGKVPYRVTYGQGRAATLGAVRLSAISVGGDNQLGFGPFGQLDQTTPATITLTAGGRSLTVTLDPTTGQASAGQIN